MLLREGEAGMEAKDASHASQTGGYQYLLLVPDLLSAITLFLYLQDSFWNEALFYQVIGFTFNVALMELTSWQY